MDHLHGVLAEQVDCQQESWPVHGKDGTEDWILAASRQAWLGETMRSCTSGKIDSSCKRASIQGSRTWHGQISFPEPHPYLPNISTHANGLRRGC